MPTSCCRHVRILVCGSSDNQLTSSSVLTTISLTLQSGRRSTWLYFCFLLWLSLPYIFTDIWKWHISVKTWYFKLCFYFACSHAAKHTLSTCLYFWAIPAKSWHNKTWPSSTRQGRLYVFFILIFFSVYVLLCLCLCLSLSAFIFWDDNTVKLWEHMHSSSGCCD